MKGLYKKISAGVLALALVLGGSLSQGAMAYAHSGKERCQDEINKCKDELSDPKKPSGHSWVDDIDKESNERVLRDYQERYGYEVIGKSKKDPKPGEQNYYLKKNYDNVWHFIDCMEFHLEKHRPEGLRYYNIGGEYFEILFK